MYIVLNFLYHVILVVLLIGLGWNTISLKEPRKQIMSATIMLPLLLRFLNIK